MGSLSGDRDRKKREKEDGILCLKENLESQLILHFFCHNISVMLQNVSGGKK